MLRSFILVVLCALAAGFSPAKVEDNLYCDACVEVAKELESQGCDLACELIPAPYAAMALKPSADVPATHTFSIHAGTGATSSARGFWT